jgi:hypothetical protein
MRRCSHGVEKETKDDTAPVNKSKIIVPFNNLDMMKSKLEGYDLDKIRELGKELSIPNAGVKGIKKLVVEILEYLKAKGDVECQV